MPFYERISICYLTKNIEIPTMLILDTIIMRLAKPSRSWLIMVTDWTLGRAIWSEIIRVISKSNEGAARVRFEITSMISLRPNLHDPKFSYHFIRSILKLHNFMALNVRFWCNVRGWADLLETTLWHLIWYAKRSLLAEVSHDEAKWTDRRETSAGFQRVVWWSRRPHFWSKDYVCLLTATS